jgi:hypothetical protein
MPTLKEQANLALVKGGNAVCHNCKGIFLIRCGGFAKHLRSCNERKMLRDAIESRRARAQVSEQVEI